MTDLLRVRFPADAEAPAAARRAVDLVATSVGHRIDDVRLLVVELVSNSLVHGTPLEGGTIELVVSTDGAVVRVAVVDGGSVVPPGPSLDADPNRLGGRGLRMVAGMASRWGYTWGQGTTVWFEIGRGDRAPVDSAEALQRVDRAVAGVDPSSVAAVACAVLVEIMEHGSAAYYRAGPDRVPLLTAAASSGDAAHPIGLPEAASGIAAAVLGGDGRPVVVDDGRIRAVPVGEGAGRGALVCAGPPAPYDVPMAVLRHLAVATGRDRGRVAGDSSQDRLVADLRFLATASEMLSSSLDYEHTLGQVARLVVPARAHWCTINLVEPGRAIRRVAAEHRDPAAQARLGALLDRSPHDPDAPTGVPRVIATGDPLLISEVSDTVLEETANDPEYLRITRELAIGSCIIVPLVAHGVVLGTISLVSVDAGLLRFDETDLAMAVDLGRLAGLAIANARTYRDRASVARALQATLLPDELPDIPGLEVAVSYRPAAVDLEIGGDFYDVLPGPDGTWYALVGDVQGKGPEAATLIGLARHTARSAALRGASPVDVLESLNTALIAAPGTRTCTAVCVLARTGAGGRWRVSVARGGHPAPVLWSSGDGFAALEPAGTLLGAFDDPRLAAMDADLEPGDAMVLYTDGALARDAVSDQRIVEAAVRGGDASAIAAAVADLSDGTDDTAVVVIRPVTPS